MAGHFGRILRYNENATPAENIITDTASRYFARLNDGEFINSTTGCIIGQGKVIRRTTDGGVTWDVVYTPPGPPSGFASSWGHGLDFSSNGSNGVAVGTEGFIALSADSGLTWTELQPPPQVRPLNAVAFMPPFLIPPPTTVYAVGFHGLILRSDDNGATWSDKSIPNANDSFHGVAFANPSVGFVVGDNQSVYRTTNGGQSWRPVEVITLGPNAVRICGDNGVLLFRDAGVWTQPRSLTNERLFKLAFQGTGHGFAVGMNFLIAEYRL